MDQTEAQKEEAAEWFSPDALAESYQDRPQVVSAGQTLAGSLDEGAIDFQQACWLQNQGEYCPWKPGVNGDMEYRLCEAGTWYHLGETIRASSTLAAFNAGQDAAAPDRRFSAADTWAKPNTLVWYSSALSFNTHGTNIYRLGRLVTINPNAEPIIVDAAIADSLSNVRQQLLKWQVHQKDTKTYSNDFGPRVTLKNYNILPVTASLELHIYPYWRQLREEPLDPLTCSPNPVFCELKWDKLDLVGPNEYSEGRYYFWLKPNDFEMAAWVCRGIMDVPDHIAKSRALAQIDVQTIPLVLKYFRADDTQPPAPGFTRMVWRDFMARYHDPTWSQEIVPADRADSIPYYMLDGHSNLAPMHLAPVTRTRTAPFGTWGYSFRGYKVAAPTTSRTRFSEYDEAVAITTNLPLPPGALIGSSERAPYYWATHQRPNDVPLPPHRILQTQANGTSALFPLQALQYVETILIDDPQAFSAPPTPWHKPDTSSQGPPASSTQGTTSTSPRLPPRTTTERVRAQTQPTVTPEAQGTPPPTAPSGAAPPTPRRQSQRSPAPPTTLPFEQFFSGAAAPPSPADSLNNALLHGLADLPPACPDPNWGTRRQLQRTLLLIPDLPGATNRPVAAGNAPVVGFLTSLISTTAQYDAGLARNLTTYLGNFLANAAVGQGGMNPPPSPGPPGGPDPRGPRGPDPRPRSPATRGGSSDPRSSGAPSSGGLFSLKRPRPDNDPRDEDSHRRRPGRSPSPRRGHRQDSSPPSPRYRRHSRSPARGRSPRRHERRSSSRPSRRADASPRRHEKRTSPNPPRQSKSSPRRSDKHSPTRSDRRAADPPRERRAVSPSNDLVAPPRRLAPISNKVERESLPPPPDRYRDSETQSRHETSQAELREFASKPITYRRGSGAADTALNYAHSDPTVRPDTKAIGRTILHHIARNLKQGDYDPPPAEQARGRPSETSESPPPRKTISEHLAEWPEALKDIEAGRFKESSSSPRKRSSIPTRNVAAVAYLRSGRPRAAAPATQPQPTPTTEELPLPPPPPPMAAPSHNPFPPTRETSPAPEGMSPSLSASPMRTLSSPLLEYDPDSPAPEASPIPHLSLPPPATLASPKQRAKSPSLRLPQATEAAGSSGGSSLANPTNGLAATSTAPAQVKVVALNPFEDNQTAPTSTITNALAPPTTKGETATTTTPPVKKRDSKTHTPDAPKKKKKNKRKKTQDGDIEQQDTEPRMKRLRKVKS